MTFDRAVLLSVDAKSYGGRQDPSQDRLQHELKEILNAATEVSGLDMSSWHTQVSGDGEFSVIHDQGAEVRLLDAYFPEVHRRLLERAGRRPPNDQLRLRMALHYGMMRPAPFGYSGAGPVEVSRLLNSAPLRNLIEAPGVLIALAISSGVYHDIVEGGHVALSPADFAECEVVEKELRTTAYLHAPILTGKQVARILSANHKDGKQPPENAGRGPVVETRLKNVHIDRAVFGPSGTV